MLACWAGEYIFLTEQMLHRWRCVCVCVCIEGRNMWLLWKKYLPSFSFVCSFCIFVTLTSFRSSKSLESLILDYWLMIIIICWRHCVYFCLLFVAGFMEIISIYLFLFPFHLSGLWFFWLMPRRYTLPLDYSSAVCPTVYKTWFWLDIITANLRRRQTVFLLSDEEQLYSKH